MKTSSETDIPRALAKVNAELEAFESQPGHVYTGGHMGGPGAMGRMRGMGGGFVRSGGELIASHLNFRW